MSRCQAVARPLARHLRPQCVLPIRSFTTSSVRTAELQDSQPSSSKTTPPPPTTTTTPQQEAGPLDLDPDTVLPQFEAELMKAGKMPIGSRRRRVALRTAATNLPFEHLPYQAFQEARKILAADRAEKVTKIQEMVEKIARLEARNPEDPAENLTQQDKTKRIKSMQKYLEELKLLADINDPVVKKRFEDGLGDMNKPIYRHYAEKKWRSYEQKLIAQRIQQFSIVPDVLPKLEPTADVQLYFRQLKVSPGDIVDSEISENPPRLRAQVFDAGERLVSIVVLDADVPDVERNGFTKRCHYIATNVPLGPTNSSLPLSHIRGEDQLAVPWLPAFAQKGSPYHRMGVFLLEQAEGQRVDAAKVRELYAANRDRFSLKSFRDKFALKPFGFNMFRSVWDEGTAGVMARAQAPGADVELRNTRVHSLKPPRKARGWEARRQGPKFRHLWKYTKRIRGLSNGRRWTKPQ